MIIANPIYDIVFKKLMEHRDIARGVLERILDTKISELDFASQEYTTASQDHRLTFFRLDFKARIRTSEGWKHVLIELQKARLQSDVDRFRMYLAEEYRSVSEVQTRTGRVQRKGLPIITIYFFGYTIDPRLPGAFKIERQYVDLITGKALEQRCDVMERLTHDAYAVQIRRLTDQQRNEVEDILAIFRQDHPADPKGHTLNIDETSSHGPLYQRIVRTLSGLTAQPDVQRDMALEDEMFMMLEYEIEEERRKREEAECKREEAECKREEAEQKYAEAQAEIARLRSLLKQDG